MSAGVGLSARARLWLSAAMPVDQILGYSFVALFVIIDPIGTAALFVGLTRALTEPASRRVAMRAVLIAGMLLLFFAFAGNALLRGLGIGLPAFRIAGGVLLFLVAIDMVFARGSGDRLTPQESRDVDPSHDISVFPLAIPLIAGPGALTTMVLLMGQAGADPVAQAAVILVLAVVLVITLVLLLIAPRIVRLLGATGVHVVSRVLGVLLAAVAMQLVLDGLVTGLGLRVGSTVQG
jgi:multiple antibiotic resistance protein